MSQVHHLFIGTTNALELDELQNEVTGEYINNAGVTVTLRDANDAEVAGATWPMAMSYVADSDGLYRAFLPDTLSLLPDARYTADIVATAGASLVGKWVLDVVAKTRR